MKSNIAKKTSIMTALIYVIVFAIFNLLVFVIFENRNNVFWTSYAFMCVAFVVQIASIILAFKSPDTESTFMGIPLVSLSLYYFFAAIFAGAVFMIFQVAPIKLAVTVQVLILAAYAVVAILALMARDVVQEVNDDVKEKVAAIKTLNVDVDVLIPQVSDPTVKKALKKLSETVKYSDPMSNDAVADIEQQIMQYMNALRVYIENNNNAEAVSVCKDIEVLFLQRNSLLKATK
ncbi:MAG: hypothetical protein IJ439_05635 [Tyzzerella sp.]|nr:hypothetical protein [Tyzzerella sp.]